MKPYVYILASAAVASFSYNAVIQARYEFPFTFAAAVICGLLPDILMFLRRDFIHADITVVLDPLNPAGSNIAEGIAKACELAETSNKDSLLRISSAPAGAIRGIFYFDDSAATIVFKRDESNKPEVFRIPRIISAITPPFIINGTEQIIIRFSPKNKTLSLQCEPLSPGWTHSLCIVAAAFLLPLVTGYPMVSVICGASTLIHLFIDSAGLDNVEWFAPFRAPEYRRFGLMKIRKDSLMTSVAISIAAFAILISNLIINTHYLKWWWFHQG